MEKSDIKTLEQTHIQLKSSPEHQKDHQFYMRLMMKRSSQKKIY